MPEQSEGTTEGTTEGTPTGTEGTTEQAKSLEDLLASLDDTARTAVLGEVHKARTEAANYRGKLRAAEPKAAEYDRLAEASKTAEERSQEAVKAADTRALASMQRVARAEVKAALTGLVDDPDSIVEDLNLARFIDDDGEINDGAIAALKTKYAGFSKRGPRPDLSQGSGANGKSVASPASDFASILQSQLGSRG
jgi:flavin-binding protein dodecin